MTRLDRIIKVFNDYDNFVRKFSALAACEAYGFDCTQWEGYAELQNIRSEASVLIGELKRHGCRREK